MKTLQIIGDNNLFDSLLVAITSDISAPALSFAINVAFIEYENIQKARLVLHSRETLSQESLTKNILSFTGTILTEESSRPCIGYYYTDNLINECWVTIIEPETEIFQTKDSQTQFIEAAKRYYQQNGLKHTEDGNLVDGLSELKYSGLSDAFIIGKEIKAYTQMYKNIFPILRKYEGRLKLFFGEFIDEYTIRICSTEEAKIRGVNTE